MFRFGFFVDQKFRRRPVFHSTEVGQRCVPFSRGPDSDWSLDNLLCAITSSSPNSFPEFSLVSPFPLLFSPIFPSDFICPPIASHSSSSADFPFRPVIFLSCFSYLACPPARKFPLFPEFLVPGIPGSKQEFLAAPFFRVLFDAAAF